MSVEPSDGRAPLSAEIVGEPEESSQMLPPPYGSAAARVSPLGTLALGCHSYTSPTLLVSPGTSWSGLSNATPPESKRLLTVIDGAVVGALPAGLQETQIGEPLPRL